MEYLRLRVAALEATAARKGLPVGGVARQSQSASALRRTAPMLEHQRGPFTRSVLLEAAQPQLAARAAPASALGLRRGHSASLSTLSALRYDRHGVPIVTGAMLRGEVLDEYAESETNAFVAQFVRRVRTGACEAV